jgi:hypothetical protein
MRMLILLILLLTLEMTEDISISGDGHIYIEREPHGLYGPIGWALIYT